MTLSVYLPHNIEFGPCQSTTKSTTKTHCSSDGKKQVISCGFPVVAGDGENSFGGLPGVVGSGSGYVISGLVIASEDGEEAFTLFNVMVPHKIVDYSFVIGSSYRHAHSLSLGGEGESDGKGGGEFDEDITLCIVTKLSTLHLIDLPLIRISDGSSSDEDDDDDDAARNYHITPSIMKASTLDGSDERRFGMVGPRTVEARGKRRAAGGGGRGKEVEGVEMIVDCVVSGKVVVFASPDGVIAEVMAVDEDENDNNNDDVNDVICGNGLGDDKITEISPHNLLTLQDGYIYSIDPKKSNKKERVHIRGSISWFCPICVPSSEDFNIAIRFSDGFLSIGVINDESEADDNDIESEGSKGKKRKHEQVTLSSSPSQSPQSRSSCEDTMTSQVNELFSLLHEFRCLVGGERVEENLWESAIEETGRGVRLLSSREDERGREGGEMDVDVAWLEGGERINFRLCGGGSSSNGGFDGVNAKGVTKVLRVKEFPSLIPNACDRGDGLGGGRSYGGTVYSRSTPLQPNSTANSPGNGNINGDNDGDNQITIPLFSYTAKEIVEGLRMGYDHVATTAGLDTKTRTKTCHGNGTTGTTIISNPSNPLGVIVPCIRSGSTRADSTDCAINGAFGVDSPSSPTREISARANINILHLARKADPGLINRHRNATAAQVSRAVRKEAVATASCGGGSFLPEAPGNLHGSSDEFLTESFAVHISSPGEKGGRGSFGQFKGGPLDGLGLGVDGKKVCGLFLPDGSAIGFVCKASDDDQSKNDSSKKDVIKNDSSKNDVTKNDSSKENPKNTPNNNEGEAERSITRIVVINVAITSTKRLLPSLVPLVRAELLEEISRRYVRGGGLREAGEALERYKGWVRGLGGDARAVGVYLANLERSLEANGNNMANFEGSEAEVRRKIDEIYERWRKISGCVG